MPIMQTMQKYKIVYADPMWNFKNYSADEPGMVHDRSRGANKHYPTATVNDICKLIPPTEDDVILLIWGLSTHIPELLKVISAWGFTLQTKAWGWTKMTKDMSHPRIGMGYWVRQCTEDCWLATKGKPHRPEWMGEPGAILTYDLDIDDTLLAPRWGLRHSEKPKECYDKIDRLFPDMYPRLEMFARNARDGWDVFGNEAPDSIDLPIGLIEDDLR